MTPVPDYVPQLVRGATKNPRDGGCLVQIANWLADPAQWTDKAVCVDSELAGLAMTINDILSDAARSQLVLLAPRLSNTRIPNPRHRAHVHYGLSVWRATRGLPLRLEYTLRAKDQAVGVRWVEDAPSAGFTYLQGLLDEYDRLTARTPVPDLTPERWAEVRELVGQA